MCTGIYSLYTIIGHGIGRVETWRCECEGARALAAFSDLCM